ncbi:MAG: sugar phosphate isomerase/epimerase [Verrucomicrobia bacterium]|nr:sugar phosphate isomerase/epimerase [Verrucomicrobiota bacterium]
MKIGIYSITYRGVWYKGEALDVFQLARLAKSQGWEGLELDTERPHAAPMDMSADDRKRLRDLAGELGLPLSAVSPNCDLSSPVPSRQEAVICYVRECIKLAHDLGAPICKIFAAWRGITLHDGIGSYDLTYSHDPYPFWKEDRRRFVVPAIRELARMAGDCGVTLAVQNHGPDIVNNYRDALSLIEEVGSPHFKACMDINIEDEPESDARAWDIVKAAGKLQVHSHVNGEFVRDASGRVVLAGAGYFDQKFWGRKVAYPAYFEALAAAGYEGFLDWEFCHPAMENGQFAGIEYVHNQTRLALEYMKKLRADALAKAAQRHPAK